MTKIELETILSQRYNELIQINNEYLSEAGRAAFEAYRDTLWHLGFHDTIESLREDEHLRDLISIEGKHSEYYKILRMIIRTIESIGG